VTDAVAALLADPRSALVALDFDGTLAPIVARPEDASPVAGAHEVLRSLAEQIGMLAVISGRAAQEVVDLSGFGDIPGLRVLGHYGLQRWQGGRVDSPPPDPAIDRVRLRLPAILEAAPDGVYVEDKEHSVAVHTRPAADPQRALDELGPVLRRLAADMGLEAVGGRYVIELRPSGIDKGAALRALVEETGAATVMYVGDDVGDLPAFRTVRALRDSGAVNGLAVVAFKAARPGETAEVPPGLREAADLVLPGPDAVVGWLAGLLAML